MDTIKFLKEIPKKNANRIFLIDSASGNTLTFKDLHILSCKIGNYLLSNGYMKGDRIAVLMGNSTSLVKLYFGCLYTGIVVVPINPNFSANQVDFILRNSGAKSVFTSPKLLSKIRKESLIKSKKEIVTIIDSTDENTKKYPNDINALKIEELKNNSKFVPFNKVTENDNLIIVYTSGTTSKPKGVVHKISSLINNGRVFSDKLSITSENRFYNMLPLTYLGGYYNLLLLPYVSSASVVLSRAFNAESALNFWDPIKKYQVNTLWFVPTIMSILMKLDRGQKGIEYCKKQIICTLVGMDILLDNLRLEFEEKYKLKLFENYGLSETLFISTQRFLSDNQKGSAGKILPGVEIKIVDKNSHDVSFGNEGEILVRTPFMMDRYYNSVSGEPDKLSPDIWFQTGDLGILNPDGELFITGRKKDLIIKGGINISPAAIEEVIYKNSYVKECAVVGIHHNIKGEEIVTVYSLITFSDRENFKQDLKMYCRENLSSIQQPDHFIELEEFPRTSSGKIQKVKIRAWLEEKFKRDKDINIKPSFQKLIDKEIDKDSYFQPSKVVADSIQAMSIEYNTMVYEMKRKNIDIIVLSLGEAFFDIPLLNFDDLPIPEIYHYSHSRGIPELRENLAKYFLEEYDVGFDPEKEIIVTAGSKIAIHMSLMSILNPGDEAIIPEPAWVSYPEQVRLCYGVPVQVPYYVEVFDFEKYITNRTKIIIINNPHNPTGKVYTLEELSHLYKLAGKYNLFILSDEAYSDFLLNEDQFVSIGNLDREKKRLILCNSISKNYGISGWRLGYVITNAALINQILKVNQHLITCPATILEHYIAKHYFEIIEITKPQIIDVVKKRKKLAKYMDNIGLKYLPGTATFYFFVSIDGSSLNSQEFCKKLLFEKHISTCPGIGYGISCDKYIRISIGTDSWDRIIYGLDTIKEFINNT